MTAPFVPMLFQGEEFNASTPFLYFTHHEDEELGKRVSEGRSLEFSGFGWTSNEIPDPQSAETLQLSKLKWEEAATEPHASMLSWYKALIRLRRTTPDLTNGRMDIIQVDCDPDDRTFRRSSRLHPCDLQFRHGDADAGGVARKPACSFSLIRTSLFTTENYHCRRIRLRYFRTNRRLRFRGIQAIGRSESEFTCQPMGREV